MSGPQLLLLCFAALLTWCVFRWWVFGLLREQLPRCLACNGVCVPHPEIKRFVCEDCNRVFSILEAQKLKARVKP